MNCILELCRPGCADPVLAFPTVTRDDKSAVLAFTALSAWLVLLLIGWTLGGAIHLLFALALLAFPWRRAGG